MTPTNPPVRPATLRVEILDANALLRSGPAWNRLLRSSAADTVFLTWEWVISWHEAYGGNRPLRIVVVAEGNDWIGIAPLVERRFVSEAGLAFRALGILGDGSGDSDYLDWISLRGREPDVVGAVTRHLAESPGAWELLLVNEIPETSPHVPLLRDAAREHRWSFESRAVPCARARLPETWEGYLAGLKPRMRTKVRRVVRSLVEEQGARFDRVERAEELPERLTSLYDLHNRRWQAEGKHGVFEGASKRAFYESLSARFLERRWLRFYSLRVGDRFVAHQYCFEYGKTMFLLQEGLDPDWFDHGAGNALRALVFRDAIEGGLTSYDFLSGVTEHKRSWGAEEHRSLRLLIGRPTAKNGLRRAIGSGLAAARLVKARLRSGERPPA